MMALLLALGALGVLGEGPLVRRTVHDGPAALRYPAVMRASSPSALEVTLPPGDTVALVVPAALARRLRVARVEPAPVAEAAVPHGTRYAIARLPGDSATVTLHVEPQRPGRVRDTLRAGDARLPVAITVLP